jgi:vesicle coat complex subunit
MVRDLEIKEKSNLHNSIQICIIIQQINFQKSIPRNQFHLIVIMLRPKSNQFHSTIYSPQVKLFLKSPATSQEMVQRVLQLATEKSDNPDLRDRGYVYWRLLHKNPEATKLVVLGDKPQIKTNIHSGVDKKLLAELIPQLSLMSSVYHVRGIK